MRPKCPPIIALRHSAPSFAKGFEFDKIVGISEILWASALNIFSSQDTY